MSKLFKIFKRLARRDYLNEPSAQTDEGNINGATLDKTPALERKAVSKLESMLKMLDLENVKLCLPGETAAEGREVPTNAEAFLALVDSEEGWTAVHLRERRFLFTLPELKQYLLEHTGDPGSSSRGGDTFFALKDNYLANSLYLGLRLDPNSSTSQINRSLAKLSANMNLKTLCTQSYYAEEANKDPLKRFPRMVSKQQAPTAKTSASTSSTPSRRQSSNRSSSDSSSRSSAVSSLTDPSTYTNPSATWNE